MFSHTFVLLIVIFLKYCEACEPDRRTVDYVQNVMIQNIAETQNFTCPTKYEEFEQGQAATEVNDYAPKKFDFIIVGAGSAGSVLATRLSEDSSYKILLIEAGCEEDLFNKIPAMALYVQRTKRNWCFSSTPQNNSCSGMVDQKCVVPRGKSIGGSSSLNALGYVRGNPDDFNRWANLGCPNWSWSNVLKYFIKSENSQINGDSGFHGFGGLLNVQYADPPTDKYPFFIRGHEELGLKFRDYNGCEQIGVARLQSNIKRGIRQSTGTAFLDYARGRKNLQVVTEALATEIIIDKKNVAKGVIFIIGDKKYKAEAKLEVIISAGTINSPQLLMLSGIGPKRHLEDLGINVRSNLPVGKNLTDHPLIFGQMFRTNYSVINNSTTNLTHQVVELLKGIGLLTSPFLWNGLSFRRSNTSTSNVPDFEYLLVQFGSDLITLAKGFNLNENITNNFILNLNPATDFMVGVELLHPESKGEITLKSKNPTDMPNINLNMMDKLGDVEKMVEALQFLLQLLQTEAFKKINATLLDLPICENVQKYSTPYWKCVIRHMTTTVYHPAGTCSMGPNNTVAVVDCEFKVFGIKKLRVIDASVIPITSSGHLNSPTIMLAEKAADLIKSIYAGTVNNNGNCRNMRFKKKRKFSQ